jgi:hypothetical protein
METTWKPHGNHIETIRPWVFETSSHSSTGTGEATARLAALVAAAWPCLVDLRGISPSFVGLSTIFIHSK